MRKVTKVTLDEFDRMTDDQQNIVISSRLENILNDGFEYVNDSLFDFGYNGFECEMLKENNIFHVISNVELENILLNGKINCVLNLPEINECVISINRRN